MKNYLWSLSAIKNYVQMWYIIILWSMFVYSSSNRTISGDKLDSHIGSLYCCECIIVKTSNWNNKNIVYT